MRRVVRGFEKLIDWLTVLLLVLLVIVVALQVVLRFAKVAAPWTQEVAQFTFVYITFFGSVLAVKEGSHISVDILVNRLPAAWRRGVQVIGNLTVIGFLGLVVYGSTFLLKVNAEVTAATMTWFKMTYLYSGVLLGISFMLLYSAAQTWQLLTGKTEGAGGEKL